MVNTTTSPDRIKTIRAFAQLFRPILGFIAALTSCATIYALNVAIPLGKYLLTVIVLMCMTSASFAIDDYWDVEQDLINHPERPLPSGDISPQKAWCATVILFVCAWTAAIPLGLYPLILVSLSILSLWNYSHLLTYSGILGNIIVAANDASLILLGSLVADRPWAMIYPIGFLFCYILAKEIVWDIHDTEGDRAQGIVTVANSWGISTAFLIAWGLLTMLLISIPLALLLLPMSYPLLFASFSSIMLLSIGIALFYYQQKPNVKTYRGLSIWGRLGMLLGIIGLLGTATPV